MKLVYTGPHDAVEVTLGEGSVVVPNGTAADFPHELAASLLEQGSDHWIKDKAPTAKEKE